MSVVNPEAFHHLVVAQEANASAYRRLVQASSPGECWDLLVLTAANEKQAEGYRRELALRSKPTGAAGAFFPLIQRSIVVADPPGRRAGSGGATLGVMKALRHELGITADDLAHLRILLIHSGGASQRLPMYSPVGKIFSPLPLLRPDGQISTLFDHLYVSLCGLPERLGPGMLILAGDVFLLFDHRHVSVPARGVTAISMRVPAELGRGHGVFVLGEERRIRRTLQKVSVEQMANEGATDKAGKILIDTGLLFFDADSTHALWRMAAAGTKRKTGLHERVSKPIDLYEDITFALSSETQGRSYISSGDKTIRSAIWKSFHDVPFRCMEVSGEFLHLGTTRQFRDAMTGRASSPAAELFQHNVLTFSETPLAAGSRVFHSAILQHETAAPEIGAGSVIEHSIIGGNCQIGRDCVVSQVLAVKSSLRLPADVLFFQVPVTVAGETRYAQVLCGTGDEFKGTVSDGKCTYLNDDIGVWLQRHGVKPRDLWGASPAEAQSLWTARLFPATTQRDACRDALWLCSTRPATSAQKQRWLRSQRVSMAMILEMSDPAQLIAHREIVAAYLQTGQMIESIRRHDASPADMLLGHFTTSQAYVSSQEMLEQFAGRPTRNPQQAMEQARALWIEGQLLSRPDHPAANEARNQIQSTMRSAFARIALASELGHSAVAVELGRAELMPVHTTVEATAPVRLDLTGGWSDTPPYCYEEGGHVINMAIDLDGKPPVRSTVTRLREHKLMLESRDLGRTLTTSASQLRQHDIDPRDPFALQIVALQLTGLLSVSGGLKITTECRVPKGSGLGTSSILAATLLAALGRISGRQLTNEQLIEMTVLLEQRLSTGGGWQDQVGGIVGGIKSTTSAPGIPQRPVVEQLAVPENRLAELEQRLVVYYSGQQRLARDILRRVEGRWLAREPAAVLLKRELKKSAVRLRSAILAGDWAAMAGEINAYWRMKKDLYPGSTTPAVDVLMLDAAGHYQAASIAGAGGGGFCYFLCETADEAGKLRELLEVRSSRPGSLGSVYQTQVNGRGLELKVSR